MKHVLERKHGRLSRHGVARETMPCVARWATLLIMVFGGVSRANAAHPSADDISGRVAGQILFTGEVPLARARDELGHQRPLLEVDQKTGGLRYAAVYLVRPDEEDADKTTPPIEREPKAIADPALPAVTMDQIDHTFVPHMLAVRSGSVVRFTNSDLANHNVRAISLEPRNQFNVFIAFNGEYKHRVSATRKNIPIVIQCDIHAWMNAWVYVFDHPWFAVTDSEGRFRIEGLPPGVYRLVVRQPDGGLSHEQSLEITAEKKAIEVEVGFDQEDLK